MGNEDAQTAERYQIQKRAQRRVVRAPRKKGRNVVFVCREVLKEIWIHADEEALTGIITFVTKSGKEIRRTLVYTWFPQGVWKLKFDKKLSGSREGVAEVVGSENVDKVIENRLASLSKGGQVYLYQFKVEGKGETDAAVDCLHLSARSRTIPVRVTYAVSSDGVSGDKIPKKLLSDDYLALLRNELVARVYLVMLEHFAGINIKEEIAKGGISRKEYRRILEIKSKDPVLDAKKIARVVTQSTFEFVQAGYGERESEYLILMTETLLYQRKRKNPLAQANQLEVAKGLLRNPTGNFSQDLGIKRRGESALLLYDKFGSAIPAWIGYMDLHYRNIDLDQIPTISIKIGDPGFAQFLKVLEQTFSFPTRETYVFLASVSDFYKFIVEEVHRVYGGEIEKRVAEMLPIAIGFFVVHAVVGAMARRGNPYAAAIIVVAKAVGWIMDIDMAIATGRKMAEAGRHFGQMEMIHRRTPKEKGKEELTLLSKYHLEMGSRALIAAMAEVIAMGVFIAGGRAGQRVSGRVSRYGGKVKNRLSEYLKSRRQDARVEITIEGDAIAKIRATKGTKTIEVQSDPTRARSSGTTRTTPTGQKLKSVDSPPLEEAGANLGRRQQSKVPKGGKTVKPLEYDGYRGADKKGRPASAEEVSGLPKEHMEAAIRTAKDLECIVILRTTNPRGVQHIINGHPPKGKDLIALNTDKVTGKVTARSRKQRRIALQKDYYILQKDGYAYNRQGQRLRAEDGSPLKFDMKARGKFKELTNRRGQVIDPKTKKAVVGDYDLQDVIDPTAPGRNYALAPETKTGDVTNPLVKRVAAYFNALIGRQGSPPRIIHGADAQFMQYRQFRKQAFKGDAIAILPNGKVVYFSNPDLVKFYKAIGRSRLTMPKGAQLQPYRKN